MGDRLVRILGAVGAAANWSIPIAAFASLNSDPAKINPTMTATLAGYSCAFMRWAIAINPPNYLLLSCHIANEIAQLTQLGRWAKYKFLDNQKPATA